MATPPKDSPVWADIETWLAKRDSCDFNRDLLQNWPEADYGRVTGRMSGSGPNLSQVPRRSNLVVNPLLQASNAVVMGKSAYAQLNRLLRRVPKMPKASPEPVRPPPEPVFVSRKHRRMVEALRRKCG